MIIRISGVISRISEVESDSNNLGLDNFPFKFAHLYNRVKIYKAIPRVWPIGRPSDEMLGR